MSELNINNQKVINQRVKLWENLNPANAFSEQNITVSNASDYDELWWYFKGHNSYSNIPGFIQITKPNFSQSSITWTGYSSNKWYIWSRQFSYVSDNIYNIKGGSEVENGTGKATNERMIPLYVLGVKY